MIDDETFEIPASLASEIEDAVMFGRPGDLEAIIESAGGDALPTDLRDGLETLGYFRAHYGSTQLNEIDRKKVVLMDSAWTMELLKKLRSRIEAALKRA